MDRQEWWAKAKAYMKMMAMSEVVMLLGFHGRKSAVAFLLDDSALARALREALPRPADEPDDVPWRFAGYSFEVGRAAMRAVFGKDLPFAEGADSPTGVYWLVEVRRDKLTVQLHEGDEASMAQMDYVLILLAEETERAFAARDCNV